MTNQSVRNALRDTWHLRYVTWSKKCHAVDYIRHLWPMDNLVILFVLFVCSFSVGNLYCPSHPPLCFVSNLRQTPLYDLPILYVFLYRYTFVSDETVNKYTIQYNTIQYSSENIPSK